MTLVERLRAFAQGEAKSGIGRKRWVLFREAADALEALQAENERLRTNYAELSGGPRTEAKLKIADAIRALGGKEVSHD